MSNGLTWPMRSTGRPFSPDDGKLTCLPASLSRAGVAGGFVGALVIWVQEAVVWVGVQNMKLLAGIPRNATGLVFGRAVQDRLGAGSYVVGTTTHFVCDLASDVLFAFISPGLRRGRIEASPVAIFYAGIA